MREPVSRLSGPNEEHLGWAEANMTDRTLPPPLLQPDLVHLTKPPGCLLLSLGVQEAA